MALDLLARPPKHMKNPDPEEQKRSFTDDGLFGVLCPRLHVLSRKR